MKQSFYSHGKLLLTAEYVVLDGALALAVPTKFGQFLEIEATKTNTISWKSLSNTNDIWFQANFNVTDDAITCHDEDDISKNIIKLLNAAKRLNPDFLKSQNGFNIVSQLEFPQNWGLGSSSTLINNIANWAKVDAFKLSNLTFGGSGYDIACAQNSTPILYQLKSDNPSIETTKFNPDFKDSLYFVHLNEKQNSRDGIKHYKAQQFDLKFSVEKVTQITKELKQANDLKAFCDLIDEHEALISKITNQETVKSRIFSGFKGSIKSLGAWGGDFILVASKENPSAYFKSKGYHTILSWDDLIL